MLWINAYLQTKLAEGVGIGVPFFPPSPNTIEDLTSSWVVINDERYNYQGVKCTFDRLIKMRRSPFPHIKSEQLLYYFYATEEGVTPKMLSTTETVLRWMDREDETAEEINAWCKANADDPRFAGNKPAFYFHRFKVYQLQETRDIVDFGTARTYGGNKIIIDFEYHQTADLTNNTPE
jgi:hypothetical protein